MAQFSMEIMRLTGSVLRGNQQCCNHNAQTVVLAHLRFFNWAGIAQKPDDLLAVFACSACHDALDRRDMSAVWGFEDILRALGETLLRQKAMGNVTTR